MSHYQGISDSVFEEPEYRDIAELVVAQYIMVNRDMAGVCPIHITTVAAKCRTSAKRLREVLDYFSDIGKLEFSREKTHVFWKSGPAHTLNRGKCSDQQVKGVLRTLQKWDASGIFNENILLRVVQLLEDKYSITIPYTALTNTKAKAKPKTEAQAELILPAPDEPAPPAAGKAVDPHDRIEIKKLFEYFNQSEWRYVLDGMGPYNWLANLYDEFGLEVIESAYPDQLAYYKREGIHKPLDPLKARGKVWENCQRHKVGLFKKKPPAPQVSEDEAIQAHRLRNEEIKSGKA